MKAQCPQTMGQYESSTKRITHISECQKKELERTYSSSLTEHLKTLEHKEANSPKRSRMQETIKLWAEINHLETNRTI